MPYINGIQQANEIMPPSQVTVAVELITPDQARQYLGFNTHNRKCRTNKVLAYANDMRSGNWQMNGASISFGADGVLQDGQHRLMAIIEADVPVAMLVVKGLQPSAQDTIDTGIQRKLSDVLTLKGEFSATALATAIRSVYIWQSGDRSFGGQSKGSVATMPQLIKCFEGNQWIRDLCPLMQRIARNAKLPIAVNAALVYAFNVADPTDAEFFWERLMSEEGHEKGDPIFALRRSLLSSKDHRGTRNVNYLAAITIKAWNKYRAGDSCDMITYRTGGAQPEKFPEVN